MLGLNTFYFKLAALLLAAIAAGYAGTLNALYMPNVSPGIATMGMKVEGLLIILIGGMGTLSGAMVGAAVYRLLDFYLLRWFGENAGFILGAVVVALVLFVLYGIVGTWKLRSLQRREGWERRLKALTGGKEGAAGENWARLDPEWNRAPLHGRGSVSITLRPVATLNPSSTTWRHGYLAPQSDRLGHTGFGFRAESFRKAGPAVIVL